MRPEELTAELVMQTYGVGAFPMARPAAPGPRGEAGEIDWYRPDPRAILPLDGRFRVRRSLRRRVRRGDFDITFNRAFERVIRACAQPRPTSSETWISEPIIRVYTELHRRGLAHSVEARRGGEVVGGLYGVALGGAFFGESMFSRVSEASQVCLVHLVEHLRARGFVLLDVQFTNPHLEQFGVAAVPCEDYLARLAAAASMDVSW